MFDKEAYHSRMQWFKHDRFGMFIHFGLYAIPARGEWVRSIEEMPESDYLPFFEEFNPDHLDMKEIAKLAKDAGMKYAILTAKHHDGFCLFDSAYTDFKVTNTPYKKDIVKEFVEAFSNEGIKIGLYYSLIDWHHPHFEHYQDAHDPMRNNEAFNHPVDFNQYLDYMHAQVRELCTNYGKIDIMWFDFSYDHKRGEYWQATKLVNMVRELQPNIILDNRLEVSGSGFGSIASTNPLPYSGDYVSPEQIIPPHGITNEIGEPVYWEACVTMNDNWGYHSHDHNFKESSTIIRKLVECVSKNGNLLLNIGPNGRGEIPQPSIQILKEIAKWMKDNAKSIYGCGIADYPKPENGRMTQNGKYVYYHILENNIGGIPLYGIPKASIKKIRLLQDGSEVKPLDMWTTKNYPDIVFVKLSEKAALPNSVDTVLEIELQ